MTPELTSAASPILIVPYVWIGDFVRCHSVVKLLRAQAPERPVDIVSSTLCAPLADYMPGMRQAIVIDLPRRRLGLALQRQLAGRLRESELRAGAGDVAQVEGGAGAVSCRHCAAHRLCRRSAASVCSTTCAGANASCRA